MDLLKVSDEEVGMMGGEPALPGAAAARQAEEQREQQDGRHYSLPSAAPMSSRMASTAALEASA